MMIAVCTCSSLIYQSQSINHNLSITIYQSQSINHNLSITIQSHTHVHITGTSRKTPFWIADHLASNFENGMDMLPFRVPALDMEVCLCFLRVANVKLPLVNLRKAIWTQYCCVKSPKASMMLDRFITFAKRLTKTHQFTKMCYFIGDPDDSGPQQVRITHLRFYMRKQTLQNTDLPGDISNNIRFKIKDLTRLVLSF